MKRLMMRKIREALRLHASGLSTRKIATSLGVGQSTASEYLKRIERAALTWPLAAEMTDVELEALLFHPVGGASRLVEAQPDWPVIHRELKRPGVTLSLLWEEYRAVHPDGYGYSRFCDLHRRWTGRLTPVAPKVRVPRNAPAPCCRRATVCRLRGNHAGGRRRDNGRSSSGAAVRGRPWGFEPDLCRGELEPEPFGLDLCALPGLRLLRRRSGASGLRQRSLSAIGPRTMDAKSGVTKACFYEPAVNRTYADMAAHYGTAVVPARPYKPRE